MGATIPLAPFTEQLLLPKIQGSAMAAAEQCNGPDNACGLVWTDHTEYKSTTGIGEQMAALEIFKANLVQTVDGPVTEKNGGTSKGNDESNRSGSGNSERTDIRTRKIEGGDKAGAGILAALAVVMPVGAAAFMVMTS